LVKICYHYGLKLEREDPLTEINLQMLMQQAADAFQPQNAAGLDAVLQFNISGSQGGNWFATIRDQKLTVEPGAAPNPNLTITADTADIFNMVAGKLNPMQAYMQGKVRIQGDMGLAMRLMNVFKRPSGF
jgi:putative sterol carrier protein